VGSGAGAERALEIVAVRAWPVRVERLADFRPKTAKGGPTHSEYALLEVETAGGFVGLGEATTAPAWNGEDAVGTADLLARVLAPDLVGLRVDRWPDVAAVVDRVVRRRPFLRAAIEMACLDAEGRVKGVPAAELLGGVVRTELSTKFVLPARDPELVGEMAAAAVARGASALKVKVGLDLDRDLTRVRLVRVAAAGRPLAVDANEGWSPDDPQGLARLLRPLGLAAVEQPFPRDAVTSSMVLQRSMDAAVVADESAWDEADVRSAAESGSFSEVSLYPGKVGGLRRCLRLAALAHEVGLAVSYGSNLELGVGAAAMAHAMAATAHLSERVPSDLIGPLYFASSLVQDDDFVRFDGASLPSGPGLGVRLDADAVAEHRLRPAA
jgi:muconate cycloisomerase